MPKFTTKNGLLIPAVTEAQMREIDRIAMEDFGLGVLQMMENAGRNLALHVLDMLGDGGGDVLVLAGTGGNGGGGICCARHLHNRGVRVSLALTRPPGEYTGPAAHQLHILQVAGVQPLAPGDVIPALKQAALVVDALIGYSLRGAPCGRTAELIEACNQSTRPGYCRWMFPRG